MIYRNLHNCGLDPEECKRSFHEGKIDPPCCFECPYCGKRVKNIFFGKHKERCGKNPPHSLQKLTRLFKKSFRWGLIPI